MPLYKSAEVAKVPVTLDQAGQMVVSIGTYEVPDTLAANDIVALCHLPAEHEIVDFTLQSDDLDTGTPAIAVSVGVLNAGMTDLVSGTNLLTTSTVAQAGGVARASVVDGLQLSTSDANRVVGVKVTTAADTAAAGTLRGVLTYRRARS